MPRGTTITRSAQDLDWFSPWRSLGVHGLYAWVVLVIATRPFFDLLLRTPHWRTVTDVTWLAIFAIGLLLIIRDDGLRWLSWSIRALPFLWLVLLVALASTMWSGYPERTFGKASWLIGVSLTGVALGCLLSPRLLLRTLFWVFASVLVASVAIELLLLSGLDGETLGRSVDPRPLPPWRGTMWSSAFLGPIAAAAALYFAIAVLYDRVERRSGSLLGAMAIVVTVASRSSTSIVMVVTGVAMLGCLWIGQRVRFGRDLTLLLAAVGLSAAASVGIVYWQHTTILLDESVTASGRVPVWQDAYGVISYGPVLGHGYSAVWGLAGYSVFPEFESTKWASHAHNGYLQVATQLGIPATLGALLFIGQTLLRSITAFVRWSSAFALFVLIYTMMFIIQNMMEAPLFERRLLDWDWLLFVTLATAVARAERAGSR